MATILIVDDEDVVRNTLQELFAAEHICHAAETAEQALAYLSVQQYDVVVTDYRMPGLSGLDLLDNLKQSQPDTLVILMSGLSTEERRQDLIQMGAFDYISKPFRLKDAEICVTRAIAHHEQLMKRHKEASSFDHVAQA